MAYQNLDTDIAVAGKYDAAEVPGDGKSYADAGDGWTKNTEGKINGFVADGNAYVAKKGAPITTVTTNTGKPIKIYNLNGFTGDSNDNFTKITADNTDLNGGATAWGKTSAMKTAYAAAYNIDNNGSTKFYTGGATPTAVDTMPDAVTDPSQVTTMTWDEGEYVYNMPTNTTSCGSKPNGIEDCAVIVNSTTGGRSANPEDPDGMCRLNLS